jgi:hypothetical protein
MIPAEAADAVGPQGTHVVVRELGVRGVGLVERGVERGAREGPQHRQHHPLGTHALSEIVVDDGDLGSRLTALVCHRHQG